MKDPEKWKTMFLFHLVEPSDESVTPLLSAPNWLRVGCMILSSYCIGNNFKYSTRNPVQVNDKIGSYSTESVAMTHRW
jgi:hypothetical protein